MHQSRNRKVYLCTLELEFFSHIAHTAKTRPWFLQSVASLLNTLSNLLKVGQESSLILFLKFDLLDQQGFLSLQVINL